MGLCGKVIVIFLFFPLLFFASISLKEPCNKIDYCTLDYDPLSHMLEGSVDEFFQWDAEENLRAVLFVSITLLERNKKGAHKKLLFQGTYNTLRPVIKRSRLRGRGDE